MASTRLYLLLLAGVHAAPLSKYREDIAEVSSDMDNLVLERAASSNTACSTGDTCRRCLSLPSGCKWCGAREHHLREQGCFDAGALDSACSPEELVEQEQGMDFDEHGPYFDARELERKEKEEEEKMFGGLKRLGNWALSSVTGMGGGSSLWKQAVGQCSTTMTAYRITTAKAHFTLANKNVADCDSHPAAHARALSLSLTHTHVCARAHTHAHTYARTHTHTHTHACAHAHTPANSRARTHTQVADSGGLGMYLGVMPKDYREVYKSGVMYKVLLSVDPDFTTYSMCNADCECTDAACKSGADPRKVGEKRFPWSEYHTGAWFSLTSQAEDAGGWKFLAMEHINVECFLAWAAAGAAAGGCSVTCPRDMVDYKMKHRFDAATCVREAFTCECMHTPDCLICAMQHSAHVCVVNFAAEAFRTFEAAHSAPGEMCAPQFEHVQYWSAARLVNGQSG